MKRFVCHPFVSTEVRGMVRVKITTEFEDVPT